MKHTLRDDTQMQLSFENHQLQQLVFKYKKENVELKQRVEDQSKHMEQLKQTINQQNNKIEEGKRQVMEQERQIEKRDQIIDRLQKVMRQLATLRDDGPMVGESHEYSRSLLQKKQNNLSNQLEFQRYENKVKTMARSNIHKEQLKLPNIHSVQDEENLTVMSVPKRQLRPIDKNQVATMLQQHQN